MREGSTALLGNTGNGVGPGAYAPPPNHPMGGTFALQTMFGTYQPPISPLSPNQPWDNPIVHCRALSSPMLDNTTGNLDHLC